MKKHRHYRYRSVFFHGEATGTFECYIIHMEEPVLKWDDIFPDWAIGLTPAFATRKANLAEIVGSAIFVLPSYFITAKHNLDDGAQRLIPGHPDYARYDDHRDRFRRIEQDIEKSNVDFEVDLLHVLKKGTAVWNIHEIGINLDTDIALIHAETSKDNKVKRIMKTVGGPPLNLHPPKEGDMLLSVGFRESERIQEPGTVKSTHTLEFHRLTGKVLEVRFNLLGSDEYREPYIWGEFAIHGGMSGGPVLNENGQVVGMNSRGIVDITTFIPMYHALGLQINTSQFGKVTLLELLEKGGGYISGLEHVVVRDGRIYWNEGVTCSECSFGEGASGGNGLL